MRTFKRYIHALPRGWEPSYNMKSFRSSFHNLSHIGSSTASITPALMLADQCSKAFDQIAALLTDIRSISTPENVLVIEQGLESAIDSAIGTTLAETIRQHADNCSKNDKETIQSALSEAMTFINTCCEIAKKAQKKNKWDKDPQNKLEQNWFLFCREIIKVSKLLPLRQVDLQSIHSLCKDDSVRKATQTFEGIWANSLAGCKLGIGRPRPSTILSHDRVSNGGSPSNLKRIALQVK